MAKYIVNYSVVIEAEDLDDAAIWADEIEGRIQDVSKKIVEVSSDPYLEKL